MFFFLQLIILITFIYTYLFNIIINTIVLSNLNRKIFKYKQNYFINLSLRKS